jgi:hypothetical protein
MNQIVRTRLSGAIAFASLPLLSQTTPARKPAFAVVPIRPSPANGGFRSFGTRGNSFTISELLPFRARSGRDMIAAQPSHRGGARRDRFHLDNWQLNIK